VTPPARTAEPCRFLEFDSDLFGIRVAEVCGDTLDEQSAAAVAAWCRDNDVDCLYFLAADDPDSAKAAVRAGFTNVDERVTLAKRLEPGESGGLSLETAEGEDGRVAGLASAERPQVRPCEARDVPPLVEMARANHHDSRFYVDPGFGRKAADRLFETWIAKSCDGWAERVLVAELEGEPVGYVTCHLDEDAGGPGRPPAGRIGLVGVAEARRGTGVGSAVLAAALEWFDEQGANVVTVTTQGRNAAARALYEAAGFETESARTWYHLWPKRPGRSGGYDPAFFAKLERLEARSFWFRARNKLIAWALGRCFPAARDFLEVGCGTGFVLAGLARARPGLVLTGADLFPQALDAARRRLPAARLVVADALALQFEAEFDAAGAFDVIEHISDDVRALSEIRRVLRPSGGLILTVPQDPGMYGPADERAGHVRRYDAGELAAEVEAAGFEILLSTSFVSLLLPAMKWSRRPRATDAALASARPNAARGEDQLDIPGLGLPAPLDWALAAVMALERLLIRAGARFSKGGSRMIVARKI
jgi:SAM-dependent methyltransferase